MLPFLKKDLRLVLRDPGELLLLLGMPLLLIAILGFALGNLLGTGGSTGPPIHIQAALVVQDDAAQGREALRRALAQGDRPALQRAGLFMGSQSFDPLEILKEFLLSEELRELMTVQELTATEAADALEAGELHAVITLPAGFSGALYTRMLLNEGESAEIRVELSEDAPLGASIVRDILQGFAAEFSLQTVLQQLAAERGELPQLTTPDQPVVTGSLERVSGTGRQVSSFAYYAFGMAVMFMLYLIGNSGTRAYLELSNLSFDRIIISNTRPISFLLSKALTAAIVGFAQIMILIVVSNLLFGALRGQPAEFWLQAAVISAALALAVGSLAALVTAIVMRTANNALANAFNSIIVFVFALLGGSFVPLGDGTSLFARIGEGTPNGAALTALLAAARGAELNVWGGSVAKLALITVIAMLAALLLLPRSRSN